MKECLGLILLISSINAFSFPEKHDLTYDYHGTVNLFSGCNNETISKYDIFGMIKVRSCESSTIVQLKNFSHNLFLGNKHENLNENTNEPRNENILELPVYIPKEQDILNPKILSRENEELWSFQIKKAIIMLFNYDEHQLKSEKGEENHLKENLGFRTDRVSYKVIEKNAESISFKKEACSSNSALTNSIHRFENIHEGPVSSCLKRYLDIVLSNVSIPFIKKITSSNTYRSSDQNDVQYIEVFQKIHLSSNELRPTEDKEDLSVYFDLENAEKYEHYSENNDFSIIEKTKILLQSIDDYMENLQIDLSKSENTNRDVLKLKENLKKMNQTSLQELYQYLSSSESNRTKHLSQIYLNVLSYVNTDSSILTMLDLIGKGEVCDNLAVRMLKALEPQCKRTENKIMDSLIDSIMTNDNVSDNVLFSAILAASRFLNGEYLNESLNDAIKEIHTHFLSKSLLQNINDAKLSIHVLPLSNMRSPVVEKILTKTEPYDKIPLHTRALAMLTALNDVTELDKKSEEFYKSVVLDEKEDIEARAMALQILSDRSRPELLFDIIHTLSDEEICDYSYDVIQKISSGNSEKFHGYEKKAFELLSRLNKCASKRLQINSIKRLIFEALNSISSNCELISFGDLKSHGFITFLAKIFTSVDGKVLQRDSVYLNLRFPDGFPVKAAFEYSDLLQILYEHAVIEIVSLRDNVVVFAESYDRKGTDNIMKQIHSRVLELNLFSVNFPISAEEVFTTDIGIPVAFYADEFVVKSLDSDSTRGNTSLDLRKWNRLEHGIKIYNPLSDSWYGYRKVHTVQYRASVNFMFIFYYVVNLRWKSIDGNNDFMGVQSSGQTEIFRDCNKHDQDFTKEFCAQCQNNNAFKNINKNRLNYTICENDDEYTGLTYQAKIFDCDESVLKAQVKKFKEIISPKNMNYPLGLNKLHEMFNYLSRFPEFGTCGVGIRFEDSKKYPTIYKFLALDPSEIFTKKFENLQSDYTIRLYYIRYKKEGVPEKTFSLNLTLNDANEEDMKLGLKFKNNDNFTFDINANRKVCGNNLKGNINFTKGCYNEIENTFHDSISLNVQINGSLSQEQTNNFEEENSIYDKCMENPDYTFDACISSITALRNYDYAIKFDNLTESHYLWLLKKFHNHYPKKTVDVLQKDLELSKLRFNKRYDLLSQELFLSMVTSDLNETFKGIPIDGNRLLQPFSVFECKNLLPKFYCEIGLRHIQRPLDRRTHDFNTSVEWTTILSHDVPGEMEIRIKKVTGDHESLMLNVIIGNNSLVFDKDDIVKVSLNDQFVSIDEKLRYQKTTGVEYLFINNNKTVIIHLINLSVNIEYNGDTVKLSYSPKQYNNISLCQ